MSHPTWEYHLESSANVSEERLNELGLRGWELVQIEPASKRAIFKRPGPDYRERITIAQRESLDLPSGGAERR